ncbi:MAG: insulinase family protein [Rhodothermales bacterium]|nr:insulinase family protein [Rhodothermales bacterium]
MNVDRLSGLLFLVLFVAAGCASTDPTPSATTVTASPPVSVASASPLADALPLDPAVRVGQLPNGLRYFIRHNEEPRNRMEMRLAIDAGSLLEADDQRGLAHFLEHMLFNGTRRFEKSALVDFLERTGMQFGADVNAYTSFDETVYELTIPADSAEIVARSFDVLEDWAAYATLDAEEIDKERGVVVEEWRRSTQNAGGRIREKTLPVLLHESRYATRLPIGDTTTIRNAPREVIERFYRHWYRPDLMAVVIVGDIDVDAIEAEIQTHFAHLPNPADAPARATYPVPGHAEPLYAIVTDPEYPYTTVATYYKHNARSFETVADYRDRIVAGLFDSMLNKRLSEIAQQSAPPFVGASVSQGAMVRSSAFHSLGAQVQEDGILAGLEALLVEARRVREHGFTASELMRDKQETVRAYERAFNERENTQSARFANEYVAYFLESEPTPGIAYEYDLVRQLIPDITLADVNRRAAELISDSNRVMLVTMPEKAGLVPPSEADLAAVFAAAESTPITPWVDAVSEAPLMASLPTPGSIVERTGIDSLDVTALTLSNGIRIYHKPTDYKDDEVRFSATSPGGTSLVDDDAYFTASSAAMLVGQSGVGPFDPIELEKALSGKVVSVAPFISSYDEGLGGGAAPADLETMFQLIHLYFTASRVDSSALTSYQNRMRAYLPNRASTPQGVFQDSLVQALYAGHPRARVPTLDMVETLDLDAAHRFYQDRFADASDFIFTFVGNFDPDTLEALAQTYLGSLPAPRRGDAWRDVEPSIPNRLVDVSVSKGIADQSQALLIFHGPTDYTRESRHALRSMVDVFNILLREDLREARGGVYSVSAQSSIDEKPRPEYQISVSFTCDPARVDELVAAVFDQIESLKTLGSSPENLEKIKEQQRRSRETQKETNGFWTGILDFYSTHPDEDWLDVFRYEEMIEAIDAGDIQAAARQYFDESRYVRAVLYPEAAPVAPGSN